MNQATHSFIEELKARENVLGVILFGSWARGNNRPESDVDLVVIQTEGYSRAVEKHGEQLFEIIYVTEKDALDFWKNNLDDAFSLWEVAKIIYDKDGTAVRIESEIKHVFELGKKPIDFSRLNQLNFEANDYLQYVEGIAESDPTTANLILSDRIFGLTKLFFDLKQMWTPAPKQRVAKIRELNEGLYKLLSDFYSDNQSLTEKIVAGRKIVKAVFED